MRKKIDLSELEFVKTKNEQIKVYGLGKNAFFGDLSWSKLGVIKKSKSSNDFAFFIKPFVVSICENTLFQIHKKVEELNKE